MACFVVPGTLFRVEKDVPRDVKGLHARETVRVRVPVGVVLLGELLVRRLDHDRICGGVHLEGLVVVQPGRPHRVERVARDSSAFASTRAPLSSCHHAEEPVGGRVSPRTRQELTRRGTGERGLMSGFSGARDRGPLTWLAALRTLDAGPLRILHRSPPIGGRYIDLWLTPVNPSAGVPRSRRFSGWRPGTGALGRGPPGQVALWTRLASTIVTRAYALSCLRRAHR